MEDYTWGRRTREARGSLGHNQVVSRAAFPLEALGENRPLLLLALWSPVVLDLWP